MPSCGVEVDFDLDLCKPHEEASFVRSDDRELQSFPFAASNMGPLVPHEPQAALAAAKKEFGEYDSCRALYTFLLRSCMRVTSLWHQPRMTPEC